MRAPTLAALAIAALVPAGCDSGTVPPPGQTARGDDAPEVAADEVVLRGDGLAAGAEAFYFSAGENEVRGALSAALGEQGRVSQEDDCGAGPMTNVGYPGGLVANFQNGRLVGWTLSERSADVRIDADIAIGMPLEAVAEIPGYAAIDTGSMGQEFALGPDIGGFIADDAVVILYAGTQCFFR